LPPDVTKELLRMAEALCRQRGIVSD